MPNDNLTPNYPRPTKVKDAPASDILYLRNLPPFLKAYFKSYCVKRNKSMTEVIVGFMQEKVAEDKQ